MPLLGYAATPEVMDEAQEQANALLDAVEAQDFSTAYIIASTCKDPALLAVLVAEIALAERED